MGVSAFFREQRRIILCLIVTLAVIWLWQYSEASAEAKDESIQVYVDTKQLEFDVPPMVKNGTTLVPFRALFETMGLQVEWNAAQQTVTGKDDALTITLRIGEKSATVNNELVTLLQAAESTDGRTFVPLRFIGEATGAFVVWDPYNRDINMITTAYMEENNISREALEEAIEEYFASRESEQAEDPGSSDSGEKEEGSKEPPGPIAPVDLNKLEGMYYGWRSDFGGYECGGICWELYTFLPNQQVVIGSPAGGGPETINCNVDECTGYTINGGQLKLSNGETLSIGKDEYGYLVVNDVRLDAVQPVEAGTTLDGDYQYIGYRGLIGIDAAATSWTYYLTLYSDGTFEISNVSIGSVGATGDPSTHVGHVDETTVGTYSIEGNTIEMKASDGTVTKTLFFIHNDNPQDRVVDIQIGNHNYYVDSLDS